MTMSIIQPNALGDGTFARATTGTYTDAAGVLQTAGINVPRLNYDPADLTAAPQLLVEAAATNLLRFSDQFENAAWTKSNLSVSANVVIGGLTVDKLVENTAVNAEHFTEQTLTSAAGTYTTVWRVVAGERALGSVMLVHVGESTTTSEVAFDLSAKTIVVSNGRITAASIKTLADGSVELKIIYSITAATTSFRQRLRINSDAGASLYTGNGTSGMHVVSVQTETGAVATSYIPTTTATVTRAADVVSTTGLIYSSAAENDFPEWAAPTAYALDAKVIRASTHRIYRRLVAGTTATAPELDAINWLDIAPTNRWAMFDDKVGTMTSLTGGLTVAMRPGAVSGLALLEMAGRKATVVMKDAPGGVTVYSKTVSLDATLITSVYDWFYKDYEQMTDLVLTDLPAQFVSNELTITISSTTTASVGVCKFGELTNVGQTQYGASVGITDYSRKDVDAFGNVLITKRAFSKRADFSIVTEAADFAALFRKFTAIRATPCVFIGTEAAGFDPFIVYGFYKDFSIVVPYPTNHLCNVSIEGLI